jgi:hypothetical protein
MNYKTLVDLRAETQERLRALKGQEMNSEEGRQLLKRLQGLNEDLRGYDREIAALTSSTGNYPK